MQLDSGAAALLAGLALLALIAITPAAYLKALGGLLIILTIGAIVLDASRLLFG